MAGVPDSIPTKVNFVLIEMIQFCLKILSFLETPHQWVGVWVVAWMGGLMDGLMGGGHVKSLKI